MENFLVIKALKRRKITNIFQTGDCFYNKVEKNFSFFPDEVIRNSSLDDIMFLTGKERFPAQIMWIFFSLFFFSVYMCSVKARIGKQQNLSNTSPGMLTVQPMSS